MTLHFLGVVWCKSLRPIVDWLVNWLVDWLVDGFLD